MYLTTRNVVPKIWTNLGEGYMR